MASERSRGVGLTADGHIVLFDDEDAQAAELKHGARVSTVPDHLIDVGSWLLPIDVTDSGTDRVRILFPRGLDDEIARARRQARFMLLHIEEKRTGREKGPAPQVDDDRRWTVLLSFAEGLAGLEDALGGATEEPSLEQLAAQAREAGERFVAAQRWAALTGERVDTATLRERLGISRQALHQRVAAATLLAVPGTGTNWYPTWQLRPVDGTDRLEVRSVVAQVLQRFRDQLGDETDPYAILSWAATPQPELKGSTPRDWIELGLEDQPVIDAASRAAAALAR